ncbi:hypothetical protein RB195_007264 [Necator americanus]|uniref:Cation transporting ATPase n=1 Tax=Necator americanus TaxID=51031 RepID=A0ABR1BWD6_NECAM
MATEKYRRARNAARSPEGHRSTVPWIRARDIAAMDFRSPLCDEDEIKMLQRNPLVAIACGQFALSLMQAMFMFYYVRIYLNVFQVPQQWFNIAQTLFLFWNAINDPLFGYMQNK